MTTDATPRPDLDAIEAYCADFEVVGEAGSTCAACDGPWTDHEECATGVLLTLVAYARALEGALVRVRRFLDVPVREWLPNEHVSCDIGCSHFAMESECFLALNDEVEAITTLLAPERGATEPTHE